MVVQSLSTFRRLPHEAQYDHLNYIGPSVEPGVRDFSQCSTCLCRPVRLHLLRQRKRHLRSFSGTASVAYGANGAFNYKTATGSIACNNATFGDPIFGTVKACYYQAVSSAARPVTPSVPTKTAP